MSKKLEVQATSNPPKIADLLAGDLAAFKGAGAGVIAKEGSVFVISKENLHLGRLAEIFKNFSLDLEEAHSYTGGGFFIKEFITTDAVPSERHADFTDVFAAILNDDFNNNLLNSLCLKSGLNKEKIYLLNAISQYLWQCLELPKPDRIYRTFANHPKTTKALMEYFYLKFSSKPRLEVLKETEKNLFGMLNKVDVIEEDKILHLTMLVMKAALRTNFFNKGNETLAIKFDVDLYASYLNGVQPKYEIFLFHKDFVGVHMRKTKVSRGGLRWSDRGKDYRKEVKALMQAQRSKNSVIVPSGAKGGFFIKEPVDNDKFVRVYKLYINACLDLVDNYNGDKPVLSKNPVYDDFDPYFVVAADKGTSAMSDTANAISNKRGFWLGDAFASGGSIGFDHKKMGVTAKGALTATNRYFIEHGINIQKDSISVVGIGSMAGDVFGNAMIANKNFALVAAVSSKEIFVDPTPDLEASFNERVRLFKGELRWKDYNQKLISKGGGVFLKNQKSIKITPQMKQVFEIEEDELSGYELVKKILTSKVDMLFNGGVGTYVRGSGEDDSVIGDEPNAPVRINADELRAACVSEGGNLGLSQKARMDYAKIGGFVSADSIDNSAGVNTSDYEVNIKIILDAMLRSKVISEANRKKILAGLTDNVETRVVRNTYYQGLALSLDAIRSKTRLEKFKRCIEVLKHEVDSFKPSQYAIPKLSNFSVALDKTGTIIRPILSVLLSFSKIFLKQLLLSDREFFKDPLAQDFLFDYFPADFSKNYKNFIVKHPLKDEIMATKIANMIINTLGVTFISDYDTIGKKRFMAKVKAFLIVNKITKLTAVRQEICLRDLSEKAAVQYDYFFQIEDAFNTAFNFVDPSVDYLSKPYEKSFEKLIDKDFAKVFALAKVAPLAIALSQKLSQDFIKTAADLFALLEKLEIMDLFSIVNKIISKNEWEESFRYKLEQKLSKAVIELNKFLVKKELDPSKPAGVMEHLNRKELNDYMDSFQAVRLSQEVNLIGLLTVIDKLNKAVNGKN